MIERCSWCLGDPLYVRYHDEEWGVPEHDDHRLFAKLILDGAQAGLSWLTILRKTEGYLSVFEGLSPERMARFDALKIERLLADPRIVRNRKKIEAAVGNARAFLELVERQGSFNDFLWDFVDGQVIQNSWKRLRDVPAKTKPSEAMSKALMGVGFRFVGPTICYAFMQAVGMVNDHLLDCFRHRQLGGYPPGNRGSAALK